MLKLRWNCLLALPILAGGPGLFATREVRAASARARASGGFSGGFVPWRGLHFQQDGLHNCGTVSMLMAWANAHPQQAARMVRQLPDGTLRVEFANAPAVSILPRDLSLARRVSLVSCDTDDVWALAVLTAFARLKSRAHSPGASPDFRATEWIYAGEIGQCLSRGRSSIFHIKPMSQRKGKISIGAPIPLRALETQFRRLGGRPTVAYNNRCVHIWAILGFDARRMMVRARNPRRSQSVWMSLRQFRDQFQILVSAAS